MQIDGKKIRHRREELGMTQEKLAAMSRVNERTIQRAEAGAALSAETVAQIAAALRKQPRDLRAVECPEIQENLDQPNRVVLHRTESARAIFALFADSYGAEIECDVEPNAENVELLTTLADILYRHSPDPTPTGEGPHAGTARPDAGSPLGQRLRAVADLNREIARGADTGVRVFVGSYMRMLVVPRYDVDEGCWYTKSGWKPEPMRIAVLRISNESKDPLVVSARGAISIERIASPIENEREDSLVSNGDEVPFWDMSNSGDT